MIQNEIDLQKIIDFYEVDYLFIEGVFEPAFYKIVTASEVKNIEPFLDEKILFISGIISENMNNYREYKILNAKNDIEQIIKILENI